MGRILDLLGEVAAAMDEGAEGPQLAPDAWERLGDDWTEDEIQDAVSVVREHLLRLELVDAADSLNSRVMEFLGSFSAPEVFPTVAAEGARMDLQVMGQLARRVDRMEEILDVFREDPPPDRRAFDALRQALALLGIESDMVEEGRVAGELPEDDDEEDED
jgi:hypothetical protein